MEKEASPMNTRHNFPRRVLGMAPKDSSPDPGRFTVVSRDEVPEEV